MKIKNILLIFILISSAIGMERRTILKPSNSEYHDDICFIEWPRQYIQLYKSSVDSNGKILNHKNYKKRLKYIFHEIMNDRPESRNFLILSKDIYEDGGTFAYPLAKDYFGGLITEDEYETLTYTNSAHKLFWSRIYRNFSS